MEISLIARNIVAVGTFIPSKFDKFFFIKNNVFKENELEDSIFSEHFIQIRTDTVIILISSSNLSITSKDLEDPKHADFVLEKIIENSDIHCTAIGINFDYFMYMGNNKLEEVSKKYFYQKNTLVDSFFNVEDAAFGFYVSKDFKQARLKLDIKPQLVYDTFESKQKNVLSFEFNFHSDLEEETSADKILSIIKDAPDYFEETKNIMNIYNDNKES